MSGPFVYTPQVNYHNSPYLAPLSQNEYSPFIPQLPLGGSPSPYSANVPLPRTPSPGFTPLGSNFNQPQQNIYGQNRVPFPGSADVPGFEPEGWTRQRRPSWHGGPDPALSQPSPWLQAPTAHQRTRSFGESAFPLQQPIGLNGYWPPSSPFGTFNPTPLSPPTFYLHPWLNAEAPRGDFIFDLSSPQFAPMRYLGNNRTVVLTVEELQQPATYPSINRIQIDCDLTPQWPITLQYDPQLASSGRYPVAPPLMLGDILNAVYTSFQRNVSQYEWSKLTPREVNAVSRAYTKRCRNMPTTEMMMQNQGVKRVDYLLDKVRFKGLVRVNDGMEHVKLIVG